MLELNPVFIANYRGQGIEEIKYIDKKSGKAESFTKHALGLETSAGLQLTGEIDYPRGAAAVPVTYAKDQKILLVLNGMIKANGQTTLRIASHQAI